MEEKTFGREAKNISGERRGSSLFARGSFGLILSVSTYRMSLEDLSAKLIWGTICILSHNSMMPQNQEYMLFG